MTLETLSTPDAARYATLKQAIESRSYVRTHGSFRNYCRQVHGISRAYAYRILSGSRSQKKNISEDLRWRIWERDDFRCHYCGTRRFLAVDHIVPESNGGTLEESNLVTACKSCNCRKGSMTYEEFYPPFRVAFNILGIPFK